MLTETQKTALQGTGFLLFEDLFTEADMAPLKAEFGAVVEREAQRLFQEGTLSDLYADEPFDLRLAKIALEVPEAAAALQNRAHKGEALFQFMKHPKILDRVEALVGPDILCHPSYNVHPRLPGGQTVAHHEVRVRDDLPVPQARSQGRRHDAKQRDPSEERVHHQQHRRDGHQSDKLNRELDQAHREELL